MNSPHLTSGICARMSTSVNRRAMVGGTLGAGALGLAAYGFASAQPSTPEASDSSGTPTTGAGPTGTANTDRVAANLAQFDTQVNALQADLVAVSGQVETSAITDLVDQAGIHRDNAESLAASNDSETALLQFAVAEVTLQSARELLRVRLDYAGLPSEQARTSRELAATHEIIAAGGADLATDTDTDVAFFVTTSETLYTNAYDLYNAGEYHRAGGTGRVAAGLIRIGTVLGRGELPRRGPGDGPDGGIGPGQGPAKGRRGDKPDGPADPEDTDGGPEDSEGETSGTPSAPVEVPAPGF